MQGKLLLFCGPSGSGKTTIVHHLLKNNKQLQFSISATTRNQRANETHGVDYYFISVDEFRKKIDKNEFIEWEEVYKNGFYGTLKSEVERIWKKNGVAVFDVDVEGGLKIKKQFGDQLLAVFIQPPSIDQLHQRLQARATESPEALAARVTKAEHELTYAYLFDHVIVNDDLEKSLQEAQRLVNEFLN